MGRVLDLVALTPHEQPVDRPTEFMACPREAAVIEALGVACVGTCREVPDDAYFVARAMLDPGYAYRQLGLDVMIARVAELHGSEGLLVCMQALQNGEPLSGMADIFKIQT